MLRWPMWRTTTHQRSAGCSWPTCAGTGATPTRSTGQAHSVVLAGTTAWSWWPSRRTSCGRSSGATTRVVRFRGDPNLRAPAARGACGEIDPRHVRWPDTAAGLYGSSATGESSSITRWCAGGRESCMFATDLAAAGESGHDPAALMARLVALNGATTQSAWEDVSDESLAPQTRLGARMRRLAHRVKVRRRGAWADMRGAHRAGWLAPRAESVARRRIRLMATMLAGPCSPADAVPQSRVFPGRPARVARARRFVAAVLNGCPMTDTAVLLTSELVTNALAHTPSGDGGSFEVIVWRDADSVLVAVLDDGSDRSPATVGIDLENESGRGLGLVAALADRWGHQGGTAARAVWFLLRAR
jgi:anti-sigma regulatory factor (Ser/Thr protein kinase)